MTDAPPRGSLKPTHPNRPHGLAQHQARCRHTSSVWVWTADSGRTNEITVQLQDGEIAVGGFGFVGSLAQGMAQNLVDNLAG